ncbi:MAG: non-canonical purine NTP pyrophosphatase, partial [Pseudarthrobacter sp.]
LEYELPLNKVLADDKPVSRPLRLEAVGGRWVDVELQAVPLADDSGLEVDALGGRPGVYSARYSGDNATDASNNAKLLTELQDIPSEERTARFVSAIALTRPGQETLVSFGTVEGQILEAPRGEGGFGYDPLFLLPQADIASPRLAEGLSAAGSTVTAVTAYRTVDYPAAAERRLAIPAEGGGAPRQPPSYALLTPEDAAAELADGRLDAVIAASPSAARRIHALSPLLGCRFVAIGRSTADQAAALGMPVAAIAAEPSPAGLVAAVAAALIAPEDEGGEPP